MSKFKKLSILFILFTSLIIILLNYLFFYKTDYRVLHAGGLYKGKTYTNSIESFEKNAKGIKYLEIDLQLTNDQNLICSHNYDAKNWSYERFLLENDKKIIKECDYFSLSRWLKKNPEKIVITDFKSDNLEGLKFIKKNFQNFDQSFIPQIYDPKNYDEVKEMGYKNIIWALYRYNTTKENFSNIIKIIKNKKFFAITMSPEVAKRGLSKRIKEEAKIKILVHTINFRRDITKLIFFYNVTDVYTDTVLNQINNIIHWVWVKII